MRARMLQSRICVSPGLPPSPPPLPSLMPKEEIVLVKFGGRVVLGPRKSPAGTGGDVGETMGDGTSSPGWGAQAPVRGIHGQQ